MKKVVVELTLIIILFNFIFCNSVYAEGAESISGESKMVNILAVENATPENGYAVFETNHFSIYTLTEAPAGGTTTPPTTGDANTALLWAGAALVAVVVVTVARKKREQ